MNATLPLNVAVRVTEDHIIDGECQDTKQCAIARALQERFPFHAVNVAGSRSLSLQDAHGKLTWYEANAQGAMMRFISRFDRLKVTGRARLHTVKPRVFWLRRQGD